MMMKKNKMKKKKCHENFFFQLNKIYFYFFLKNGKQVGSEEERWAHNPKVGGSKPLPAIFFYYGRSFRGGEGMCKYHNNSNKSLVNNDSSMIFS